MKTMRMASGLSALVVLWIASPLLGQGVVARAGSCESGVVVGNLGISGLDCVGECTVTLSQGGKEENWVFSTEPRIFSIEAGGPADGILKAGDHLVAIDGVLITTRAGGRRYANLQPGEVVTIRYRRGGDLQEAAIRAGSRCTVPPEPSLTSGRAVPPPSPRPVTEPSVGIATAPRVRVLPSPKEPAPPPEASAPAVGLLSRGVFLDPTPRGRLGIGLACSHCGTQTNENTGEEVWYFSGPIEVTQVTAGGAADKAGIQIGDLITALDGHPLASEAGGRAFSSLKPGEAVRVTVQKKNGREVDLTVIPTEAEGLPLAGGIAGDFRNLQAVPDVAEPPRSLGAAVAPPAGPPDRAAFPEPLAGVMAGPDELPLRYSGTVSGVEVEVRGVPVAVSELQGARTLIINSQGLWIRIRIPAGTGGGEEKDGAPR